MKTTRSSRGKQECPTRLRRASSLLLSLSIGLGIALSLLVGWPAWAESSAVTALPPVRNTDRRAGACYSFYHVENERPYVQLAYDAGSRWDRFDFDWRRLEPQNGQWDATQLNAYDTLVDDLTAADVDMVGILLWTPAWAATEGATGLHAASFDQRPRGWYAPVPGGASIAGGDTSRQALSASSSPPQGLYLAWDDANNHWGDYVYTVVSRYGDRVKHWEIWNEPEWDYFWTGSSTDYAQLLKVGYQATKAACPDCTVLFGGLHYWANTSYYRWVLSQIADDPQAAANNHFFDVMSVHLYSRSSSVYDEVTAIRAGMTTYGVGDHPIWLTETGVPVWDDGSDPAKFDFAARQTEAAAYLIQSYANAWAAGIERYFFFRAHDSDMSESFGLVRNDQSLRPAYTAYQVAATYLVTPTFVTRDTTADVVRVMLWDTPRGKVSVLWNTTPTATEYAQPAAMGTATLVDRSGVTSTVSAVDGMYTLTLPAATANRTSPYEDDYFIGGQPWLLIEAEAANQPPTSTVRPLPDPVYTTTFTVTWEGQDAESGVWAYDVQVRDGVSGTWESWLEMTPASEGVFTGQDGHTYYFRSRALDGVGHWESWPTQPQAHTTVDLSRLFHFSVETFFADQDRDGVFSPTSEITLTQVTLRLTDAQGRHVITPTTAGAFTATVYAGSPYYVWAISADHMQVLSFQWPEGGGLYTAAYTALGLEPVTHVYLPCVKRGE